RQNNGERAFAAERVFQRLLRRPQRSPVADLVERLDVAAALLDPVGDVALFGNGWPELSQINDADARGIVVEMARDLVRMIPAGIARAAVGVEHQFAGPLVL